jgi:hypothetical protein
MTTATEAIPAPSPPELPKPDPLSIAGAIDTLLKRPTELFAQLQRGSAGRLGIQLSIVSIVSLGVFGLIIALFSNQPHQYWLVPLKITGGIFLSGLLCAPSLYIFGSLGGVEMRVSTTFGTLMASIALSSLLLFGFTPVVWIFSSSTNSIGFMGAMLIAFWLVAIFFGAGFLFKASALFGGKAKSHLTVWVFIFSIVTLQMSTTLRPIVSAPDELSMEEVLPGFSEKRFFLYHWASSIGTELETKAEGRGEKY